MFPKISPDGQRVAYTPSETWATDVNPVFVVNADGGGRQQISDNCGLPLGWTPTGDALICRRGTRAVLKLLDLRSGRCTDLLADSFDRDLRSGGHGGVRGADLSSDGQWIAFHARTSPASSQIFVAKFHPGSKITSEESIRIGNGRSYEIQPRWSSDNSSLYFLSERDGHACIWWQRLDRVTKRPIGDPLAVSHFHELRRPMNRLGYGLGGGTLVLALEESTGNIWMMKPK